MTNLMHILLLESLYYFLNEYILLTSTIACPVVIGCPDGNKDFAALAPFISIDVEGGCTN